MTNGPFPGPIHPQPLPGEDLNLHQLTQKVNSQASEIGKLTSRISALEAQVSALQRVPVPRFFSKVGTITSSTAVHGGIGVVTLKPEEAGIKGINSQSNVLVSIAEVIGGVRSNGDAVFTLNSVVPKDDGTVDVEISVDVFNLDRDLPVFVAAVIWP